MSSGFVGAVRSQVPLLAGVSAAHLGQRRRAWAIDAALVVLAAAVAFGLLQTGRTDLALWPVLAAMAGVVAQVALLVGRGQSVGRMLLGLRTVDDLTGLPVSLRSLPSRLTRPQPGLGVVTADLARGRDPLDLALPVVTARARPPDAVALVFDTGRRHVLHGRLLIGRSPSNTDVPGGMAADHPLLGMADLSRTLARTHALLEWSGSELWVTDLDTAHGSSLVTPGGERHPLSPGVRVAAGIGWTVHCGDRFFSVHAVQQDRDS